MDDGQLFCIEYPATVKNDDKMLETLGGYQHINETFSQPNRKLELKFRPETPGKHKCLVLLQVPKHFVPVQIF